MRSIQRNCLCGEGEEEVGPVSKLPIMLKDNKASRK